MHPIVPRTALAAAFAVGALAPQAADGSPVTGIVRSELVTQAPTTTLNLSSGWFTAMSTAPYPSVTTDNRTPQPDGFVPMLTAEAERDGVRKGP